MPSLSVRRGGDGRDRCGCARWWVWIDGSNKDWDLPFSAMYDVASPHHIVYGGIATVAGGREFAVVACMLVVGADTMAPAVVQGRDVARCSGGWCGF